jgi:hypothetical protein
MSDKKQKSLYLTKKYDPSCALCLHGKPAPDGSCVLCSLRGVMRPNSSCKKYEYDPIKRRPDRTPQLPEFDPEQFAI